MYERLQEITITSKAKINIFWKKFKHLGYPKLHIFSRDFSPASTVCVLSKILFFLKLSNYNIL